MMPNGRRREPPPTGGPDVVEAANVDTAHEELRPLMFSMDKLRHLGATSEVFVRGDR
jgi:hypothetical protein